MLGRAMALADLIGRRRLYLEYESAKSGLRRIGTQTVAAGDAAPFVDGLAALALGADYLSGALALAAGISVEFGEVTFQRALDDIVSRMPVLADPVDFGLGEKVPRYKVVQAIYQQHGFTLARATSTEVVRKVQHAIRKVVEGGRGADAVDTIMREVSGATRAYSEQVLRTNLTTSYAAGRLQQAADPNLADVVLGLRYSATPDSRVRPNHAALNGLTARHDDPVWSTAAPPNGYSCFPGHVVVSGEIRGGLRARYRGPVVEVDVDSKHRVTATPGHPVLTPSGYVPAGALRVGDEVLVSDEAGGMTPEPIAEVFARMEPDAAPARLHDDDLHGDAANAEREARTATAASGLLRRRTQRPKRADDDASGSALAKEILRQRLAAAATVTATSRYEWDAHVYDVEDTAGWIVAGGIVTSNCRCSLLLSTIFNTPKHLLGPDGRLLRGVIPSGGGPDPGFWKSRPDDAVYGGRKLVGLTPSPRR